MKYLYTLLICLFFIEQGICQSIPKVSLYLGQRPPGNTPLIFKLEVTQGTFPAERIAISKDGLEIYYSEIKSYYPVAGAKLKYYKNVNNKWTGPFVLFDNYFVPSLSFSGDTLYFEKDNYSYYSVRNGSGWQIPRMCYSTIDSALCVRSIVIQ